MILENQLVLPFNIPTKYTKFIYYKDNIDLDYINNMICDAICFGEFGMPTTSDILLHNVSHIIRQIYIKEDGIYCDLKILDTANGKKLKMLIEDGAKILFRCNTRSNSNNNLTTIISINALLLENDFFNISSYYRLKKIKQLMK